MEEETIVEETIEETQETPTEPSQETDPVEEELEKVENTKRTKLERLKYNKERIEKEIAEEAARNGESLDDDRPLTVREFKAMQMHEAQETAKQIAEREIVNPSELRLTLHYLENAIKPSGDAATDLQNARLMVAAVKNRQLAEESGRAATARTYSTAAGAPPKQESKVPELTREEQDFARMTGLTAEEIAASRS